MALCSSADCSSAPPSSALGGSGLVLARSAHPRPCVRLGKATGSADPSQTGSIDQRAWDRVLRDLQDVRSFWQSRSAAGNFRFCAGWSARCSRPADFSWCWACAWFVAWLGCSTTSAPRSTVPSVPGCSGPAAGTIVPAARSVWAAAATAPTDQVRCLDWSTGRCQATCRSTAGSLCWDPSSSVSGSSRLRSFAKEDRGSSSSSSTFCGAGSVPWNGSCQ